MKPVEILLSLCLGCLSLVNAQADNRGLPVDHVTQAAGKADFYLSPQGSDTWSGTLARPNAKGTDGPFASLERARDAVRELKKSKSDDIVVFVREGTYSLTRTVVFGVEDSGEGESTVTYAAYPGDTPVFSSGREIKGWKSELPRKGGRGRKWFAVVS